MSETNKAPADVERAFTRAWGAANPNFCRTLHDHEVAEDFFRAGFAASAAEIAALRAIADENYTDLMVQARESWGDRYHGVSQTEFEAFLRSRVVHKPTASLRALLAASAAERERLPEVERLAEHVRTCADIAQFCRDLYQQSDGLGGPASYVNGTLLGILQRLAQMIMQAEIRTAELQRESSGASKL